MEACPTMAALDTGVACLFPDSVAVYRDTTLVVPKKSEVNRAFRPCEEDENHAARNLLVSATPRGL